MEHLFIPTHQIIKWKNGEYNDKTARIYRSFWKLLGHGYYTTIYSAYHKDRLIPIYAEVYGNIHESKVLLHISSIVGSLLRKQNKRESLSLRCGAAYSKTNFNLGTAFE